MIQLIFMQRQHGVKKHTLIIVSLYFLPCSDALQVQTELFSARDVFK